MQLYTVLSAEALATNQPAHDYFVRRQASVRRMIEEKVVSWHPKPPKAAQLLMAFLDGIQMAWLRDAEVDMVAQWELLAPALMRPR